jgi:D-lactate dehydrogenase
MRIAVFGTRDYDRDFLAHANAAAGSPLEFTFYEPYLDPTTALLARGFAGVSVFVNDQVDRETLALLREGGTRVVALRCAGFNNVDLGAAAEQGLTVVRVPEYSPHAVAEHAVGLMLSLNRRINRAYNRVREGNFELNGLLGFDMYGRTVGVFGTGRIGTAVVEILRGFGCRILAHDPSPNARCAELGAEYVPAEQLCRESDIVTLHCPLTPQTHHLINRSAIAGMKPGVMLINTSRGGLIDTRAVIDGLKDGKLGYLGLDVYEEEGDLFFQDLSSRVLTDDVFARLLTFPNVIVTGHQAFFTIEAMTAIARTTVANLSVFASGRRPENVVTLEQVAPSKSSARG